MLLDNYLNYRVFLSSLHNMKLVVLLYRSIEVQMAAKHLCTVMIVIIWAVRKYFLYPVIMIDMIDGWKKSLFLKYLSVMIFYMPIIIAIIKSSREIHQVTWFSTSPIKSIWCHDMHLNQLIYCSMCCSESRGH